MTQNDKPGDPAKMSPAETGNASNPSAGEMDKKISQQEKYLRESANIGDMPDAQDQKDADEQLRQSRH